MRRYKAAAFTVSSMYAGLAGVLLALIFTRIVPETFGLDLSVEFLAMIVIGGLGSVRGAVLGGIFVSMLPQVLDHYSGLAPVPRTGRAAAASRRVRPRTSPSAPRSSPCSSSRPAGSAASGAPAVTASLSIPKEKTT